VLIDFAIEKSINLSSFWRAGGFPSVHSGISSSICVVIGISTGWGGPLFALAFGMSFLFWYDAMNVRYQAGMHAKYLNDIRLNLQDLLKIGQNLQFLKERLGHTFVEVIGGIVIG
jgi:acid phosphatase family membrane protein YuiD